MATYKKNNQFLQILQDEDPSSPRDWDNVGIIATWNQRYTLGDIQPKEDPEEFIQNLPEGTHMLPIFMYDHSGLVLQTTPFSCPWDSGQLGIIYATPERIKELGVNENHINKILVGEVKTYSQYLEGEVYGYTRYTYATCPMCKHAEKEIGDSCWGFYGMDFEESGLLEAAGVEDLSAWEEIND